jgi:hypothetical protein
VIRNTDATIYGKDMRRAFTRAAPRYRVHVTAASIRDAFHADKLNYGLAEVTPEVTKTRPRVPRGVRPLRRTHGRPVSVAARGHCKSGEKPADIPNTPQSVYANDGWSGIGDWLGTGKLPPGQYRSFKDARAFVHALGLKSGTEWKEYCRSGNKPADIPAIPHNGYANDGWAGMRDWLGTGAVVSRFRQYRSFKEARTFARGLKLKSKIEWSGYCRSGKKPEDIPADPRGVYLNDGWSGWEIGSELERSLPVNIDLSRQQARSVTSTLPTRRSQVNYHRHESSQPHASARLRADARGRDGGVRPELAAGVVLRSGTRSAFGGKADIICSF